MTNVGQGAFDECTNLMNLTIGSGVVLIGSRAFFDCARLTNVIIPQSVTYIEDWAFGFCTGLKSLTIPNGVTSIGSFAFSGCGTLTSVTIGNGVTNIGQGAFNECTSLTNATIGYGVTGIAYGAFQDCTNLTGVYFHGNAPVDNNGGVSGRLFDGVAQVTVYYLPGTTGWDTTFAERPTALWALPYPMILSSGPGFGAAPNGFGFLISWATNAAVVVEASPSLATPVWTPVSTNSLNAGTSQFTDPQWTKYPTRFYRLVTP